AVARRAGRPACAMAGGCVMPIGAEHPGPVTRFWAKILGGNSGGYKHFWSGEPLQPACGLARSEERRVGKVCRCGWSRGYYQAEDGIRVSSVTGVQTCALPIFAVARRAGRPACAMAGGCVMPIGAEHPGPVTSFWAKILGGNSGGYKHFWSGEPLQPACGLA